MNLTAAGPAGTDHDPFAGAPAGGGDALTLPVDRYRAAGATDEEVAELVSYFDGLARSERRDAADWHGDASDEDVAEVLARFREARDAYVALGGLSDEQRDALAQLTDDERDELAALTPEEREALATLTPGAGAVQGAAATEGESAGEEHGDPQNAAESAAQPNRFATEQIGDLTIAEVEAAIDAGEVTAADALAAEQARGDDARKRLVAALSKRV